MRGRAPWAVEFLDVGVRQQMSLEPWFPPELFLTQVTLVNMMCVLGWILTEMFVINIRLGSGLYVQWLQWSSNVFLEVVVATLLAMSWRHCYRLPLQLCLLQLLEILQLLVLLSIRITISIHVCMCCPITLSTAHRGRVLIWRWQATVIVLIHWRTCWVVEGWKYTAWWVYLGQSIRVLLTGAEVGRRWGWPKDWWLV